MTALRPFAFLGLAVLAACHASPEQLPGNREDHHPYAGIAAAETVHAAGTEPFWSADVAGGRLIYRTPDNQKGEAVPVSRFAGRGGVSFSGELAAGAATLAIMPGRCSDGMSDRSYPFDALLEIDGQIHKGCAWTDRHPASGPAKP